MLHIGHISVETTNNSVMFSTYVEQKSISITMGGSVYPSCGSCFSTGKKCDIVSFSILCKVSSHHRHFMFIICVPIKQLIIKVDSNQHLDDLNVQ